MRLLDMFAGVVHQADNVMVIERVVRETTCAPDAHEPGRAQQAQLMRDGRFGEADELRQVADAALPVGQRVNEPDARRIPEELEDLGDGLDGPDA